MGEGRSPDEVNVIAAVGYAVADIPEESRKEIMALVMEGVDKGRVVYGPLDTETDERDFLEEATEEARDLLVYLGAASLHPPKPSTRIQIRLLLWLQVRVLALLLGARHGK